MSVKWSPIAVTRSYFIHISLLKVSTSVVWYIIEPMALMLCGIFKKCSIRSITLLGVPFYIFPPSLTAQITFQTWVKEQYGNVEMKLFPNKEFKTFA
jgi:hypothetical protein